MRAVTQADGCDPKDSDHEFDVSEVGSRNIIIGRRTASSRTEAHFPSLPSAAPTAGSSQRETAHNSCRHRCWEHTCRLPSSHHVLSSVSRLIIPCPLREAFPSRLWGGRDEEVLLSVWPRPPCSSGSESKGA